MKTGTFLMVVGLAVGLASCSAEMGNTVDLAAEEAAVRAVSARWLELESDKDAAGIAALFATDGTISWEDQDPVVGQTAIEAMLNRNHEENPREVDSWETERVDVAASGDLAIEYGSWSTRNGGLDGNEDDEGRYVTVYRKVEGEWKVSSDMGLSTVPNEE